MQFGRKQHNEDKPGNDELITKARKDKNTKKK